MTNYPYLPEGKSLYTPEYATITPEQAQEIIDRTNNLQSVDEYGSWKRNRKVNQNQVDSYAYTMQQNMWDERADQQVISISAINGVAVGGLNRLLAIIKSGKTYRFRIEYCDPVKDENYVTNLNTCLAQTAGQTLNMFGLSPKKASKITSLIKSIFTIFGYAPGKKINSWEIKEFYDINKDLLDSYLENWQDDPHIPCRIMFAMDFFSRYVLDDEKEFSDKLLNAMQGVEPVYTHDPIWRIKEWFSKKVRTKKFKSNDAVYIYQLMDGYHRLKANKQYSSDDNYRVIRFNEDITFLITKEEFLEKRKLK